MARGEPGVPASFRWRDREWVVAEVLETWKEHGDCTHGSGERYVRKHGFRLRTADGAVFKVYFQRHFGKAKRAERWWIQSMTDLSLPDQGNQGQQPFSRPDPGEIGAIL